MGSEKMKLFFFLLGLISLHRSLAQNTWSCGDNGNYTASSAYATNLASVFASLISSMGNSGFYSTGASVEPDRVSATALCRADLLLEECRNCIGNATVEILQYCPLAREAILWRDYCTLRYSSQPFAGAATQTPAMYLIAPWEVRNTSVQEFNSNLRPLLDDVRDQAVHSGPAVKVATGNRTAPDFMTLYALLQCTPDISADGCQQCLDVAIRQIPECCNARGGARVLFPSCTLRYETNLFYNLTRIQEVQALLTLPPPQSFTPRTSTSPLPPPPSPPGLPTTITIVIAVAVAAIFAIIASCAFIMVKRNEKEKRKKRDQETNTINSGAVDDDPITEESLQYDFDKVKAATNGFSEANKLGQGGFGVVYKGILENGKEIAVKRLREGSEQRDLEFKNEVTLVTKLQHRNLVRLFGFAIKKIERLLIFEYVKNGSLDYFIFDSTRRFEIDWIKRYKIIGGIARGILYLHEGSRFRIIHRDLKASNILLDNEFNPKIADFGTARMFVIDESEDNTSRIMGTYGYMAPEYALHGQLSIKIDVFSFGVLVLEIVTGQKNNSFVINGERVECMLSFAWRSWQEGKAESMIDPLFVGLAPSLSPAMPSGPNLSTRFGVQN